MDEWTDILEENGWSEGKLMNRYDAVIHMTSTSHGAEHVYSTGNNQARRESVEEARGVDDRVQAAWKDHPGLAVVDNSTGWEEKLNRTYGALVRNPQIKTAFPEAVTNIRYFNRAPVEQESEGPRQSSRDGGTPTKVYLVKQGDAMLTLPGVASDIPTDITYTFLAGAEDRTLKKTVHGLTKTYVLSTWKQGCWHTQRLSKKAYQLLLPDADPKLKAVEVRRYNLVVQGRLLTLDCILAPQKVQLISFRGKDANFGDFEAWRSSLSLEDVSKDPAYRTRRSLSQEFAPQA
jgi:hypothetical protein